MSSRSACHAVLACGALAACGRDPGVLAIDLGREANSLQVAPAPTRWEVGFSANDEPPSRSVLASGAWPSEGLELSLDADSIGRFDVAFADDSGGSLAFGQSPFLTIAQLPGRRLSLFVQRRGELARPSPDLDGRVAPLLAVAAERLLIVGGQGPALAAYDLALGGTLATQTLERSPDAMAATATSLFSASGARLVRFDLATAESADASLPSEVRGDELAGAPLLARGAGWAWVGPARAGEPSSAIVLGDDHSMQIARLPEAHARVPATALADASILLLTAAGAYQATPSGIAQVPFPQLESPEAIAVLDDGTTAVIARSGGAASVYRIPPACDASCTAEPTGEVACAARAQLVALGAEALLACDDAAGATRVYRVADGAPLELTLREARRSASLVRLGATEAALVGGGPASFERYRAL